MSKVSRSVYAKLQAENKRLMADIRVMACGECFDAIQMRLKWRAKFKAEEELYSAITEMLKMVNKK
jgi:hypothetical protein